MKTYIVKYIEITVPDLEQFFKCQADNTGHALEQFEDTDTSCEIISIIKQG